MLQEATLIFVTSEAPWETDINTFVKETGFEGKDPDGEKGATACEPPPP